jgi:isopenicillin-N N-acyltransferase-like protein
MNSQLPIVHVKGSHFQMGQQIGEAMRDPIQSMLAIYQLSFEHSYKQLQLTWGQAVLQGKKYYPFAEEHMPHYVEELRGMAQGAGVNFDDLMVLNCTEAIVSDALHLGCTSIAVRSDYSADAHVLLGHNEDWLPDDEVNTYLVHATPEDEPAFLAMSYGGLLPNIGFNANGIAQCCDTVYPGDVRVGIPRIFVSRAVLAATSIRHAIQAALHRKRAAGYNHLIVDKHGELYNVEVSAQQFALIYGNEGYTAHTNHYQTPEMKQIESKPDELIGAHMRFNRAKRLLKEHNQHSPETFKTILSDHVNYPHGICGHTVAEDPPLDRQKTICTLIIDLTALEMHACWGNPCESEFFTYKLEI